jgi:hypothetical protein
MAMPVADFLSISIAVIFMLFEIRIFNRKASREVLESS